jgi:glycosyltransferase involved in cell wall biosynthesis
MKFVIFTPIVKTSAIGRMACLVANALVSNGHEIAVVRTEKESCFDQDIHNFNTEPVFWSDIERINFLTGEADAVVYQIGDNYEFHLGCLEWLPKMPGIVCLHDFYLGHLFLGWAENHRLQADAELGAFYGVEIAKRFFEHQNSGGFLEETRVTAPMTEWLCSMAAGVVTHSSWAIARVTNSCPGPVHVIPLAYDAPRSKPISSTAEPSSDDRFRILTIGHVNSNKRISSAIQAIGESPALRLSSIYRLVGLIHPETSAELNELSSKNGVKLEISGEVDDEELRAAIHEADVVICLRWPSLEAASASAIESMLYGKPTIVTDTGFYSEIPDEFVIKINPMHEIADVKSKLEYLFKNPEQRKLLGARAKSWAADKFSADDYALSLIEVCRASNNAKPIVGAISYFAKLLIDWGATDDLICLKETLEPLRIFEDIASEQFDTNVTDL